MSAAAWHMSDTIGLVCFVVAFLLLNYLTDRSARRWAEARASFRPLEKNPPEQKEGMLHVIDMDEHGRPRWHA